LAVFAVTSALSVLGGFAAAVTTSLPGVLGLAIGLAGLFFTHAAWQRRVIGFWGLIVLASVNTLIAMVASALNQNVGILGPLLWDAAALALFSMRRDFFATAASG
jgi:hypothetical protein